MLNLNLLHQCNLTLKTWNQDLKNCKAKVFQDRLQIYELGVAHELTQELIFENAQASKSQFIQWNLSAESSTLIGFTIVTQLRRNKISYKGECEDLKKLKEQLDCKIPFTTFYNIYEPIKLLKITQLGEIQLVKNLISGQTEVAKILKLSLQTCPLMQVLIFNIKQYIEQELKISIYLTQYSHQYIMKLNSYYIERNMLVLLFDYCEIHSLKMLIWYHKEKVPQHIARKVMKKLLKAVEHMHKHGIVHRDLKLDNILMQSYENLNSLRIIDFGLSNMLTQKKHLNSICGTVGYMAPEIVEQESYNELCDIYSLGAIFYYLLTGKSIYQQVFNEKLLKDSKYEKAQYQIEKIKDPDARDLLRNMMSEKNIRFSTKECLAHPYFSRTLVDKISSIRSITIKNPFQLYNNE